MMRAISEWSRVGATVLGMTALAPLLSCAARKPSPATAPTGLTAPRTLPLSRVFVLETSGPPPSDTSVNFVAGTPRVIVLRHGPPENIVFARLSFTASAFADTGRLVQVDVHPRPGVYGLDLGTSLPLREKGAIVVFDYSRFFSAPARASHVYRSNVAFEQALAVGRLMPEGQIELLPSSRQAADNLGSEIPAAGSYLVAAPQ